MEKFNIFRDLEYCNTVTLLLNYKCKYGYNTLITDIYMAENVMNMTKLNRSAFFKQVMNELSECDIDV